MSIEHRLVLAHELVMTVTAGQVTNSLMYEAETRLGEDPEFKAHFSQIADCRGVTKNLITPDGLIKLAAITPFESTARRCYVVEEKQAQSYASLFGMKSSGSNDYYLVTDNMEAAWEWLGIEPIEWA